MYVGKQLNKNKGSNKKELSRQLCTYCREQ
jgi:hypothetical protein